MMCPHHGQMFVASCLYCQGGMAQAQAAAHQAREARAYAAQLAAARQQAGRAEPRDITAEITVTFAENQE